MRRPSRAGRGFSLTELLVVVAVVLILIALMVVGIQSLQSHALQVKCQHQLEQIGHACAMYTSKHRVLPESSNVATGRPWYESLTKVGYLDNPAVLLCPCGEQQVVQDVQQPGNIPQGTLDALRWLKKKQDPGTGAWVYDGASYGANNAVSSLALLVFLTAGCTDAKPPEFATTVKRGAEYLVAQNDNGSFRRGTAETYYTEGMAVMTMCEAARRLEGAKLREGARKAAQDGVNYIANAQSATLGGFSYGGGGQDMSVSGWNIQAYGSGREAGLSIPQAAADKTAIMLDKCLFLGKTRCVSGLYVCQQSGCGWYGPDTGLRDCTYGSCLWQGTVSQLVGGKCPLCGASSSYLVAKCGAATGHYKAYVCSWFGVSSDLNSGKCPKCNGGVQTQADDYGSCYQYTSPPWSTARSVRLTAVALTSRRLMGRAADAADCQGQLQWLISKNYMQYATTYITDLYTVYYLTLAMYQMGGASWQTWSSAFRGPLEAKQVKTEGDDKGSWPPSWEEGAAC